MRYLLAVPILALSLSACSSDRDLLRLQRDNLLVIKESAEATSVLASAGRFEPREHDLHIHISKSVFDDVLVNFSNRQFSIDAGGREVDISLRGLRLDTRPGSAIASIDATAKDPKSGVTAGLLLDAQFVVEPGSTDPQKLVLKIVAKKIVPNLSWRGINLTKWRFVQRLVQIEAFRFTNELPVVALPLAQSFVVGSDASSEAITERIGRGRMSGIVSRSSTKTEGSIEVTQILFLTNGVHLFADMGEIK